MENKQKNILKSWQDKFKHDFHPYLNAIILILIWIVFQNIIDSKIVSRIAIIFDNPIYWALDILTIIFIIIALIKIIQFRKQKKILSDRILATLLFFLLFYVDYRFLDDNFVFIGICGQCSFGIVDVLAMNIFSFIAVALWNEYFLIHESLSNGRQSFYLEDSAIMDLSEDKLNIESYLSQVVTYVKGTINVFDNFSFAVIGKWGEGKSSFVNLLLKELEHDSNKQIMAVKYNPRQSAKSQQISKDLLNSISCQLSQRHALMGAMFNKYIDILTAGEDLNSFFKVLKLTQWGEIDKIKKDIENIIESINVRILVFIDDLDRLTAIEILEVLKLIDKNAAFKRVYFITTFDKDYVDNVLKNYLGLTSSESFVDKYFNVEINVPAQPNYVLTDIFVGEFDGLVQQNVIQKESLIILITRYYERLHELLPTLRDIKRFYNMFIFEYLLVKDDVIFEDFFLLTLIQYKYPHEYKELREKKYLIDFEFSQLYTLKGEFFNGNTYTNSAPQCIDILEDIFPKTEFEDGFLCQGSAICNRVAFNVYFSNYTNGGIYCKDLEKAFSGELNDTYKLFVDWKNSEYKDKLESYFLNRKNLSIKKEDLRRYIQV